MPYRKLPSLTAPLGLGGNITASKSIILVNPLEAEFGPASAPTQRSESLAAGPRVIPKTSKQAKKRVSNSCSPHEYLKTNPAVTPKEFEDIYSKLSPDEIKKWKKLSADRNAAKKTAKDKAVAAIASCFISTWMRLSTNIHVNEKACKESLWYDTQYMWYWDFDGLRLLNYSLTNGRYDAYRGSNFQGPGEEDDDLSDEDDDEYEEPARGGEKRKPKPPRAAPAKKRKKADPKPTAKALRASHFGGVVPRTGPTSAKLFGNAPTCELTTAPHLRGLMAQLSTRFIPDPAS
ncbi:hypothetical protein B0H14DRAFT_2611907 [Mycena olivaceomarginata]|nr:hypothetical protein B0H14DRAFT_2611907 [Mycena olivaceomarginata]